MYLQTPVPKITPKDEVEYRLEMGLAAFGGPGALQKYLEEKKQKKLEENKKERK